MKPTCFSACEAHQHPAPRRRCRAMTARGQQPLGLQLLAAQADHHHLAAEVGVAADVAQGANRDDGVGRVDGHTAAVAVLQAHHVVHVGKARQQLGLDALHGKVHHTGHALHRGGDGQDVARAHRAIGVAKALKGVARQGSCTGGLAVACGRLSRLRAPGMCSRRSCTQAPAGMSLSAWPMGTL